MVRARACTLFSRSLAYPDGMLTAAVQSGEWDQLMEQALDALGRDVPGASQAGGACRPFAGDDSESVRRMHELRAESTRLFLGLPEPVISPYEGTWLMRQGARALLYVNPHTMKVERFMRACGVAASKDNHEPVDHIATEFAFLGHLASLSAHADDGIGLVVDRAKMPGGGPEMAYELFWSDHVCAWVPRFAAALREQARDPFYERLGIYLGVLFPQGVRETETSLSA